MSLFVLLSGEDITAQLDRIERKIDKLKPAPPLPRANLTPLWDSINHLRDSINHLRAIAASIPTTER